MDDDASAVVQQAQRIVYQASWRLQEEVVLERLAGTSGLCWAPLEPRSDVIQLVTYDGEHLGHVRQDSASGPDEQWVAVPRTIGRLRALFPTALAAARALAAAAGKMPPDSRAP